MDELAAAELSKLFSPTTPRRTLRGNGTLHVDPDALHARDLKAHLRGEADPA